VVQIQCKGIKPVYNARNTISSTAMHTKFELKNDAYGAQTLASIALGINMV